VTLADIDVRKRAEEMTRNVSFYADKFPAAIGHPLLMLDQKLRIVWAAIFHDYEMRLQFPDGGVRLVRLGG
jgi:hypothetical protein